MSSKIKTKTIARTVLIILIILTGLFIVSNIFLSSPDKQYGGSMGAPPTDTNKENNNDTTEKPSGNPGDMNRQFPSVPDAGLENSVSVNVITAEKKSIKEYIITNGDVISRSSVNIYPDTAGRFIRLYVSLGDYINKGQIIGEVDPSKPGSVYSHNNVVSPISGTVTELPTDLGSSVTTQSAVAVIGDLDDLIIQCFISEKYVSKITTGNLASFTLEAYPDTLFQARIIEKSPVIDKSTRTLEIRLAPEPMDNRIQPGMYAAIELTTQKKENVIVIPDSCIIKSGDSYSVFVIGKEQKAEKRNVKSGLSSDGFTEITEGLLEDEIIVSRGQNLLSDETPVNIVK
jgi:multidrug efflux pump subunit AcrA (membrane-fusion protein)